MFPKSDLLIFASAELAGDLHKQRSRCTDGITERDPRQRHQAGGFLVGSWRIVRPPIHDTDVPQAICKPPP